MKDYEMVLDSMTETGKALEASVKVAQENGVYLAGLAIAAEQFGYALEELAEEAKRAGLKLVN